MSYLVKKIKIFSALKNHTGNNQDAGSTLPAALGRSLKDNLEAIRSIMRNSQDIVIREFSFGNHPRVDAALVFIDGMVNKSMINEGIVKPLIYDTHLMNNSALQHVDIKFVRQSLLAVADVKEKQELNDLLASVLYGNTIFLLDGFASFLDIDTKGWQARSIEEPKIEQTVRGPREGFTETIRTNTAMLRRKIHNPDLVIEQLVLGRRTRTLVSLVYVKGVAPAALIQEVKRRLELIKIDDILESGYIEEFIEDAHYSPFVTVGNSEKPDRVAARILEGRVAILVDGTPIVLTVPYLFIEGFQAQRIIILVHIMPVLSGWYESLPL